MKRKLGKITNTMLAQTLQQLESDCLIHRKQYNKIPPKVEYRLTLERKTIIPVLLKMAEWGAIHMKINKEFSSECEIIEIPVFTLKNTHIKWNELC